MVTLNQPLHNIKLTLNPQQHDCQLFRFKDLTLESLIIT